MATPSNRRLRAARLEDVPSLIELARRSWLSAFAQTAPFPLIAWWVRADGLTLRYEQHWSEMLVLEEDSVIVGLVQPKPNDAEINGLWVHPSRQGTGAGTLLLRAGEQLIHRAGHKRVWLTCSAFNERALGFYRRRGYVEFGRDRSLHAAGVEVEEVMLERFIKDGDVRGDSSDSL